MTSGSGDTARARSSTVSQGPASSRGCWDSSIAAAVAWGPFPLGHVVRWTEAVSSQEALGSLGQVDDELFDVSGGGRSVAQEAQPLSLANVDPVEAEDVEMQVQVER